MLERCEMDVVGQTYKEMLDVRETHKKMEYKKKEVEHDSKLGKLLSAWDRDSRMVAAYS